MDFNGAKDYILRRLQSELNPLLVYHSIGHTLDVWESVKAIASLEPLNGYDLSVLETAALFHDAGMINTYADHEQASVALAREVLPGFGYTTGEIEEISRLIIATRLPQQAEDLPGRIICDADLDYLGRDDYFILSFHLKLEWERFGLFRAGLREWFDLQIRFLSGHHYLTETSIRRRTQKKSENLEQILLLS